MSQAPSSSAVEACEAGGLALWTERHARGGGNAPFPGRQEQPARRGARGQGGMVAGGERASTKRKPAEPQTARARTSAGDKTVGRAGGRAGERAGGRKRHVGSGGGVRGNAVRWRRRRRVCGPPVRRPPHTPPPSCSQRIVHLFGVSEKAVYWLSRIEDNFLNTVALLSQTLCIWILFNIVHGLPDHRRVTQHEQIKFCSIQCTRWSF